MPSIQKGNSYFAWAGDDPYASWWYFFVRYVEQDESFEASEWSDDGGEERWFVLNEVIFREEDEPRRRRPDFDAFVERWARLDHSGAETELSVDPPDLSEPWIVDQFGTAVPDVAIDPFTGLEVWSLHGGAYWKKEARRLGVRVLRAVRKRGSRVTR